MNEFIVQAIGIVALIIFLISFQLKERRLILFLQMISLVVYVLHFSLLGAWTAVAIFSINAFKNLLFMFKGSQKWTNSPFLLVAFLLAFWIAGFLTYEGWYSLLGIAAITFVTFAHWQQDTKKLRILFSFSNPLWFGYDIFVGSYAGMISEVLIFTSNLVGYYKHDHAKKDK